MCRKDILQPSNKRSMQANAKSAGRCSTVPKLPAMSQTKHQELIKHGDGKDWVPSPSNPKVRDLNYSRHLRVCVCGIYASLYKLQRPADFWQASHAPKLLLSFIYNNVMSFINIFLSYRLSKPKLAANLVEQTLMQKTEPPNLPPSGEQKQNQPMYSD